MCVSLSAFVSASVSLPPSRDLSSNFLDGEVYWMAQIGWEVEAVLNLTYNCIAEQRADFGCSYTNLEFCYTSPQRPATACRNK